jgi:A/G-specific adenine glycosylase
VPHKHVFDFNQALMDFGATICTARKPKCDTCPMTRSCKSFAKMGAKKGRPKGAPAKT